MIIYKNKSFLKSEKYPDTDFIGDADWVLDDNDETDAEIEEKIISLYPNFDFVFGDNGNIVDVTETAPVPVPDPAPTDHERLEALEQAFMEFVSEVI